MKPGADQYSLLKNPLYIGKTRHQEKLYDGQHAAIVDTAVWESAQALLDRNKHHSKVRTPAKEPSLLAGLIFDDKGNPMSPTHTRKKNRRYRYYISQAALQYKERETGSVVRLSAKIIESLAVKTLLNILTIPQQLLQIVQQSRHSTSDISRMIQNAADFAVDWDKKPPPEKIALINALIYRVSVGKEAVRITFSRVGLAECIQPEFDYENYKKPALTGDEYEVAKAVYLKRTGIESKLIIAEDPPAPAHPETVLALQSAVSKAFDWNDALITGRVSSMTELAKQEDVVPQFIVRRIKFAYLAPDIVEAIFAGKVPHTLSLGALEKSLPLAWSEQRRLFGFAG